MATIAENLQTIQNIKQNIKTAIENKGVDMTNTPFSEYSTKIDEITTGGGDTPNYSYLVNTVDEDGLRALGWDDESIGYFKDNNLHYEWQNDDYTVSEENKALYGVVNASNKSSFKDNTDMEFCPMFETNTDTYMVSMFENFKYLRTIPKIDTSKQKRLSNFFKNCSSLTTIPKLETENADEMIEFFNNCSSLVVVPNLDTNKATSFYYFFGYCSSLTTIPRINTSSATYLASMFIGCSKLKTIPQLDTSNATNMNRIFYGCSSLTTIPEINTSNVTDMGYMFYSCSSLTTIPEINTSNVTNMGSMLYGCSKLVSLPKFNVPKVNAMNNMFGYSSIATLTDVGGWENLKLSWNDNNGLTRLPNLTYDSCINILNGLYDFVGNGETPTSTQGKLKVHSNFLTTATEEQIAIATNKGWTLTS